MNARVPLLASFFGAHLLLIGAATVDRAPAQDNVPAASKTGEADPIDTRITTQPSLHFRPGAKAHDWKKAKIVLSSTGFSRHQMPSTEAGVVRNAIGLAVDHQRTGFGGKDISRSEHAHADGVPRVNGMPRADSVPAMKVPAAGGGTGAGSLDPHNQRFVPAAREGGTTPYDPRFNTATNHLVINGRDLVHPGSGAGAISGRVKNMTGVIDGTAFHPRHR